MKNKLKKNIIIKKKKKNITLNLILDFLNLLIY